MSSESTDSNKNETLRRRTSSNSQDHENGTGSLPPWAKLQAIRAQIAKKKKISDDQRTKAAHASEKRNLSNSKQNDVRPSAPKFKFVWQWIENDGTWHDYDATTQLLIDNLSIGNKFTVRMGPNQWTYDITKHSADLCRFCEYPNIYFFYLNFNEVCDALKLYRYENTVRRIGSRKTSERRVGFESTYISFLWRHRETLFQIPAIATTC